MINKKFVLKEVKPWNVLQELNNVGFDSSYVVNASNKYKYMNIKIFSLTLPQANILKQTALSVGADCAVHRDVLISGVEKTDCILGGSFSQLERIISKLEHQPFGMSFLACQLKDFLNNRTVEEPKIVGILNLTKNSFSDGGKYYNFDDAVVHLNKLIEEGADIIDIGAESTKPYSVAVSAEEQLERIEPILKYISNHNINIPISIDTRLAVVAKKSIDLGASIINDVSGFDYDENMVNIVADNKVKVVIQHSQGTPENMQENPKYNNVVEDIFLQLSDKLERAQDRGIKKENIILDVGIGFGKTQVQNFELIKHIDEFRVLNCEIMLGISRKSLLNMSDSSNEEKDIYTVALNALALDKNVDYIRVHNVKLHKKLIELMKIYREV